jgi:ABC-type multidrug transport system fused ATPase/permease subunit
MDTNQYIVDYIPLSVSICLCLGYLFARKISILKNGIIGLVWILVLHIWVNWDFSYLDLFLFCYLTFISIWYDKTRSQLKKAVIDSLIILPFIMYYIAEQYYYGQLDSFKTLV